jgi:catechol 2,3-dioxygenase-like lactoylglutathione lyase family enzyme
MLLGIDHLVIAVRDPDAAAEDLADALGLAWTGGGRHASQGTFNRLAFLGDSYLELIGLLDPAMVADNPQLAVGTAALAVLETGREGLATYALASDDVVADVVRLRAAGSWIGNPVAGSRERADGETVRWVTAFPALGPDRPPFLIEHELEGAEWGDAARAARAAYRHPTGGRVRLAGLDIPVEDPAVAAGRYATEIGLTFDEAGEARLSGQRIRLRPLDGRPPVVTLAVEPGVPPLDIVGFGIRWRRSPASASGQ